MIKIAHVKETTGLNLPKEVVEVIKSIATVLDTAYGENRDVDGGDGGYILVIETKEEFEKLKDIYINVNEDIPEFVDRIAVEEGENWLNSLIIMNNDYAVTIFSSISITPQNLIDYIE